MNDFYNDYSRVVFETPEERQQKIKKQRRHFSRIFLALFIYVILSQTVVRGTYAVLSAVLPADKYHSIALSYMWSVIISCASQYLVAFPIFRLMLIGTKTAKMKEKEKLSGSEFFIIFAIGQTLMYAGNFIGNFINGIVGNITGSVPENDIANIVSSIPIWLIFICMVVLAPIVEELIFRKLMIDRLSIYGDKTAIIFSSVAFGLMHGNLYQFFYAALLGALFGYVYTRTRNIKYTIYMHAIVNFMGSIMALPVQKAAGELYEILAAASRGELINLLALIVSGTILFIYSNLEYGLMIGGIIALVHYIRKKKIVISSDKEIFIPDNEIAKYGLLNTGAILFMTVSAINILLNLIFV